MAIDSREKFSLMINEEDHLRIQVMQSGLDLSSVWEQINRIDDLIEEKVDLRLPRTLGLPDRLPHERRHGHARQRDAAPARAGDYAADRQGLPQPAEDQPGGPRPLRRRLAGDGRLLSDQQPDHPRADRGRVDPPGERHRAGDYRLRAPGPRIPRQGKPREPARPREPRLRHPPHRPDDQLPKRRCTCFPACGWG